MTTTLNDASRYRGNQLLKRKDVAIEWTPELMSEWVKCRDDVIYFAKTYMKIVHLERGVVPFDMYDYQKDMVRSMCDNRFSIFATARQAGKTSAVCAFALHYVIFNSEKVIAILANKAPTAMEVLGRIQKSYQLLPHWLQQGIIEWNKGTCVLENGSRILAAATSSDSIRGFSINAVLIDEAAFIDGWEEFYTSTFPTISGGDSTKMILLSTPKGLNHFYKMWADANKPVSDPSWNSFHPIKVTWDSVPGRDEAWRKATLAGLNNDIERFNQEYCVEFQGSSGTLISGVTLKSLVHQLPFKVHEGLAQYVIPEKEHQYVMVVDVSRGKGLDYSAFQIIDITKMPYNQVCVYKNNMVTPVDYAETINIFSKAYNNAAILVEINDIGGQVADTLYMDYESENLIYTENAGARGKRIATGFSKTTDRGVRTTKSVKAIGCSMLKLLVEQNQLIINDHNTIEELSRFSKKGSSYEAESGANDDLVMCLVLFAWMTDQQYFKDLTNINTLMKLRDKAEEELENDYMLFGFIETGHTPEDYKNEIDDDDPLSRFDSPYF